MADNPFGGMAEGIQQGQGQALQLATYKRQVIQQKFERLEKGAAQAVDMMGKGYVPAATKVQLFNQVYAPYLKMTTGVTLPPMQKWDDNFTDHMKKVGQVMTDEKIPWKDKQNLVLQLNSEIADDPRTKDAFTPFLEAIKQHTGVPDVKQVDVGGKTVSAQWDQDTQTFKPLSVEGVGSAVSPSQKSIEQQKNIQEQVAGLTKQMQEASALLNGSKLGFSDEAVNNIVSKMPGLGWLSKLSPAERQAAANNAINSLYITGGQLGLPASTIHKGLSGEDISKDLSAVGQRFKVPGAADATAPVVSPAAPVTPAATPQVPGIHPMFLNTSEAPVAPAGQQSAALPVTPDEANA